MVPSADTHAVFIQYLTDIVRVNVSIAHRKNARTLIEVRWPVNQQIVAESADLLYHLLVMWAASGVKPEDVWKELAAREDVSGITEKASRIN